MRLIQLYGTDPHLLTLKPFDRDKAHAYLVAQHPGADADHVLDHLEAHNLEDLYRNPLTLGLMGRVARTDAQLPATRAALFERVCTLVWPEHDADRQEEGLAQLSEADALDAAGAIAAGMLFSGAEVISAAGAAQVQEGDVRLADLEDLPTAEAARAIFSSKLFQSVGTSRAAPIHKVVAEYLGARWLARQADTPRAQRRILAQLHGSGGVPASLRGLHAWLAFHSPTMAERVIAADPFGVLRYGETAALTPHLADCLFGALRALAEDDPYFRASDWDSKTAAGLMIPALKSKIDAIIASTASSAHLRSLMTEALEGTSLAAELAATLEAIMLSPERLYREREAAGDALLPHRERPWWEMTIANLTAQGGEDAPRLARHLIERVNADVPNALLVTTLFAELGMTSCSLPRRIGPRVHTMHNYDRLLDAVSSTQLIGLLDLISDFAELQDKNDWENTIEIAAITARLIVRAIDEDLLGPAQAASLWRWLGAIERAHQYDRRVKQALAESLAEADDLRHAVQKHALETDRRGDSLWITDVYLQRRLVGLAARPRDIVRMLERLERDSATDTHLRRDRDDLVRIAWGANSLDPDVLAVAEALRPGDKHLTNLLNKLNNPGKTAWEIYEGKRAAKRARKRKIEFEVTRRELKKIRGELLAGKLEAIVRPAKAYLGLYNDLSENLLPSERLAEWIGPNLRDDALIGFESVLHRNDLPTLAEISNGFARGTIFSFGFAILAGLYERMRHGKGFSDLSEPVKQAGLLLCYEDHGWNLEKEKAALCAALELSVFPAFENRLVFARRWVEPALAAGNERVAALYKLAHEPDWQATGAALGAGWLTTFTEVPESVEADLVDCLTYGGALGALRDVAEVRAATTFRNLNHALSWLAIDVLVRFDCVRADLSGIGKNNPEFIWFLRDRFRLERHGMMQVTVAQAEWIITEFREQWPNAVALNSGWGDTRDHHATDFLRALINRIADDTSVEAGEAMARLTAGPDDSYANLVRHMAAEQRQKRAEEIFSPLAPRDLAALLQDAPPGNIEDLKALVLEELDVARRKLIGDDLDSVNEFWTDDGKPRDENRCRDRLAAMISPELARYGIQRITEADMPNTKRADIAFALGGMQLRIEIKGQWHTDVWDAATDQLDAQYLADWRSQQRGIYIVFWFGELPSRSNRRLKTHPCAITPPTSAKEMRTMLIARLPEGRRALIDVVVLDASAGNPTLSTKHVLQ